MGELRAGLFLNPGLAVTPCPPIHQLPHPGGNTPMPPGARSQEAAGTQRARLDLVQAEPAALGQQGAGQRQTPRPQHSAIDAIHSCFYSTGISTTARRHGSSHRGYSREQNSRVSHCCLEHSIVGRQTTNRRVGHLLSGRATCYEETQRRRRDGEGRKDKGAALRR